MSEPAFMLTTTLMRHPVTTCEAVQSIDVRVSRVRWASSEATSGLALTYTLVGDCSRLRIPVSGPPARADGLWQHTCFEVFIAVADKAGYGEWNFAPSGNWATYQFRGYRDRELSAQDAPPPQLVWRATAQRLELDARFCLPPRFVDRPLRLALSAVIEDHLGKLSYWALRHPPGKPDFHHADGFALEIAPLPKEIAKKDLR